MRPRSKVWKRVLFLAWIVWLLDAGSKAWAITYLHDNRILKILGNFLTLELTQNPGAAFSFAPSGSGFLALFAVVVIFAIGYWAPKVTSRSWGVVLGLALGGSLGNLTDRLLRSGNSDGIGFGPFKGQVIDWIRLPHWPIFNLADSAIVVAAALATLLSFRNIPPISSTPTNDTLNDPSIRNEKADGS